MVVSEIYLKGQGEIYFEELNYVSAKEVFS